ncbi:MAG: tail fiber domain-containing protein [Acidobacteriota bacterium]|nr:tail fiber domain-containing protein [Acidobacteriota bacterium]
MKLVRVLPFLCLALLLALPSSSADAAPPTGDIVDVRYFPDGVAFEPLVNHDGITLTITGPRKFVEEQTFDPGKGGFLDARSFKDGQYRWEARAIPKLDQNIKDRLVRARLEGDTEIVCQLQDEGILPMEPLVQNGYIFVDRGQIVDPNRTEEGSNAEGSRASEAEALQNTQDPILTNLYAADFVINDDLIVDGSACIGFDCVNGESFGFDTIRLKENNLRIKFDDTSVAASFPRNDWQLTANDSANGGASKFSIDDVSGNRTPFTVEANARSHSLYVDDGGRIGSRTSTPSTEIHTIDGDTPTLRLQQDGSSGFAPQTWDIAGNETNFFIRDVSNGSTLPFRIRPGAPSSSIFIDVDGDIAIGTSSVDDAVRLQVQEDTDSNFGGLRVENDGTGNIQTQFVNNADDWEWRQNFRQTRLDFNFGTVGSVSTQFSLESNGDAEFQGDVTANGVLLTSDRNMKEDFQPVDSSDILTKIGEMPVTSWSYKRDQGAVRHIGPVAQDFHAAFGIGPDDKHISSIDADGVAFAAIQALYQQLQETRAELEQLRQQLEESNTQEP